MVQQRFGLDASVEHCDRVSALGGCIGRGQHDWRGTAKETRWHWAQDWHWSHGTQWIEVRRHHYSSCVEPYRNKGETGFVASTVGNHLPTEVGDPGDPLLEGFIVGWDEVASLIYPLWIENCFPGLGFARCVAEYLALGCHTDVGDLA